MTFLPLIYCAIFGQGKYGESILPLLGNPVVFFEEFFAHLMMGESILGMGRNQGGTFTRNEVGLLTYALARGKVWMFVSAGCIMLLSFLFMLLAAWKVNPMHAASGRRRNKKKAE